MPVPSTARKARDETPGLAMVEIGVAVPVAEVENSRIDAEAGLVLVAAVFWMTYTPMPGAPVVLP